MSNDDSVLDYLTKVWENASEPEDHCVPGGSVVIARNGSAQPDYHVWTTLADEKWISLGGIRIVSSPPKVGFYMQDKGDAFYWDGSTWFYGKGGDRCGWQGYGFSAYIGDVKEDK